METRPFAQKDRCALQEIYLESRKKAFYWMDSSQFNVTDFDHDTDGERLWVATNDEHPVGFISVWIKNNFIHHLFVHPSNYGKGIGSALLKVCLDNISRPANLKCLEKNISARNFYLSSGWKITGSGDGPDGRYDLFQFGEASPKMSTNFGYFKSNVFDLRRRSS